jgi:tetratricopeptide (TPR) repeat protein
LPVVALCTYRDTEPAADTLCAEIGPERHLVLGGLAPGELAAAVRMATGSAVPEAIVEGLHARTGGNPYFAAERLAQPRLTWYLPLWQGARALMRGDLALADEHARELAALAERAGSVNARLLGLVQRFVRLICEGRAGELAGDFAEIVGLIPDDPRAAACAHALLSAHRGQLAEARADLDRVVAGTVPRDGEWLPKHAQVAVAAVLAGHRPAAEAAYRALRPYAGQCAVEGILAGSWGSVAAHLGLLARYLGRAEEAEAHFAQAAKLDAAAGAALAARTREWSAVGSDRGRPRKAAPQCWDVR